MNTYWMVHGPDGPPHVKHSTFEDARREAHRLADLNPGKTFYALQAVRAYRKVAVEEFELGAQGEATSLMDDGIPF